MEFRILLWILLLTPLKVVSQTSCCCCLLREAGQKAEREGNLRTAINDWEDAKKCSDANRCPDLDKLITSAKSKIEVDAREKGQVEQCEEEIDRLALKIDQLNVEVKDLEKENSNLTKERDRIGGLIANYEEKVWRIIDSINNVEAYKSYCKEFPNGKYYNLARQKTGADPNQNTLPELVRIPGGSFQMGTGSNYVEVTTFYLSKFEVTNAQYCTFLNEMGNQIEGGSRWIDIGSSENGYSCKITPKGTRFQVVSGFEDHPVAFVTWYGASSYCKWLSSKSGKQYRLPSTAEWEYAAGNGVKHTTYSWGFESPSGKEGGNIPDVSFCKSIAGDRKILNCPYSDYDDGFVTSAPIGSYSPNDFGIHDMSGNVWEWCENDVIINGKYGKSIKGVVIKGGSWNCDYNKYQRYYKKGKEVNIGDKYDTIESFTEFKDYDYEYSIDYEYYRESGHKISWQVPRARHISSSTIGFRVAM